MNIETLAEFFDAHGSIRLAPKPSGLLILSISIVQKKPEMVMSFRDYFDVGTVGNYVRKRPNQSSLPPYRHYTYFAYSHNACKVLRELRPYLKQQHRKAGLAITAMEVMSDLPEDYTTLLVAIKSEFAAQEILPSKAISA